MYTLFSPRRGRDPKAQGRERRERTLWVNGPPNAARTLKAFDPAVVEPRHPAP